MHPVLFTLPFAVSGHPAEIRSFAVLVALGCLCGIIRAVLAAPSAGVDANLARDLCVQVILWSLLGAHLLYVALDGRAALDACLDALSDHDLRSTLSSCGSPLWVWQGGLVFYGGIIAGALTTWFFARRHHLPFTRLTDLLCPSLALGHAIGRIGCYLAGCCWGKAASGAAVHWARHFPRASVAFEELVAARTISPLALWTPLLHPTQLYESIAELLFFALLSFLSRRPHRAGSVTLTYVAGYSCLRFLLEIFRGDPARKFALPLLTPRLNSALGLPPLEPAFLSTSQAIALIAIVLTLFAWHRLSTSQSQRS